MQTSNEKSLPWFYVHPSKKRSWKQSWKRTWKRKDVDTCNPQDTLLKTGEVQISRRSLRQNQLIVRAIFYATNSQSFSMDYPIPARYGGILVVSILFLDSEWMCEDGNLNWGLNLKSFPYNAYPLDLASDSFGRIIAMLYHLHKLNTAHDRVLRALPAYADRPNKTDIIKKTNTILVTNLQTCSLQVCWRATQFAKDVELYIDVEQEDEIMGDNVAISPDQRNAPMFQRLVDDGVRREG
jgi:hypothetical protein